MGLRRSSHPRQPSDDLKMELRRVWNLQLYRWWERYNRLYLSGALRRPVIQVEDGMAGFGRWNGSLRRLIISESHIRDHPWLSVMETLRHEMAHQAAEELLGAVGEPPHGPAFREACGRLRCDPRARVRADDLSGRELTSGKDDRLPGRIRKLLALADSPNENEAQAAMNKAHHLLLRYNLSIVDLDRERQFDILCLGEVKGRWAPFEYRLASILNDFFFVMILAAPTYDARRNREGKVLQIYGTPENLRMAEYVYTYLHHLLDSLWVRYQQTSRLPDRRERQRFFAGVLVGFHQKLQGQSHALREEHALVWKGDSRLKAYFRHQNPRTVIRYSRGVPKTRVYQDGIAQGMQITLRKPLRDAATGSAGGLLTR